jgi:Fic family protein
MKPPYEITFEILNLVSLISEKIGEVNARFLIKSNPILRKQNKIKTIHSSLSIEGNTLSESQITAILDNKRVVGPEKDIIEVINALKVYDGINNLDPFAEKDFLKAHKDLMKNLVLKPGNYRKESVGIVKGNAVEHIAPPHQNVSFLMKDLFQYLKNDKELILIKSCVFHYEMEFIHPFIDGNGRMGRLWQTVILMHQYKIFEFLSFETLIAKNQEAYYKVLSLCDKAGNSTQFIVFMLNIIHQSLNEILSESTKKLTEVERLAIFLENYSSEFSRKDYLKFFTDISSATASRDLLYGVNSNLIIKIGDKKTTIYKRANL